MAYSFVQAIKGAFAVGSPRTQTVNGTVFGNTIVLMINEGTTNSVNTVTVGGVAATLVAGPQSGTNGISANNKSIYSGPVPSGGGNIVVSYLNNGTNNTFFIVAEVGGLAIPANVQGVGKTVSNAGSSVSYNTSPDPTLLSQVFNLFERTAGAVTISGISGTDRTGLTPVNFEMNDQAGVIGTNTVTATSSSAGFGMLSVALALSSGSAQQRTLVGVGS